MRLHLSARLALAVAAAIVATPILANMAEPPQPASIRDGSLVGEPAGGLGAVRVLSEQLTIDLRPLDEGGPARVEARYRVTNDGAATRVPLWFVANGFAGDGHQVQLDGKPVAAAPVSAAELPDAWRAPATTPVPGGSAGLPYTPTREGVIGFTLLLSPGEHEIRVAYPASPSAYQDGELMPVWQLGYVLSPAREWQSFGGLEVRVEAPHGWQVTTSPAMTPSDDGLSGSWRGIPADAIAISARAPAPGAGWRYLAIAAAALLGLFGLGRLGAGLGRSLGRRGRRGAWGVIPAAAAALLLTTLFLVAWLSVPEWVAAAAGDGVNRYVISRMSYNGIGGVLLSPLVLLAAFLAMLLPALRAARRLPLSGSPGRP